MCNLYWVNILSKGNYLPPLQHLPGVTDVPRCYCCVYFFSFLLTYFSCFPNFFSLTQVPDAVLATPRCCREQRAPSRPALSCSPSPKAHWVTTGHWDATIPWMSWNHSQQSIPLPSWDTPQPPWLWFPTSSCSPTTASARCERRSEERQDLAGSFREFHLFDSAEARQHPIIQVFYSHQNAPGLTLSCCLIRNNHISNVPFSQGVRNNSSSHPCHPLRKWVPFSLEV